MENEHELTAVAKALSEFVFELFGYRMTLSMSRQFAQMLLTEAEFRGERLTVAVWKGWTSAAS